MTSKYALFYGQINEHSARTLIQHLSKAAHEAKAVHLLFHSNGGWAHDGIGLYQYLRLYPIPISIYNMRCLQSAAVLVYLGASRRIAGPASTFMLHSAYKEGAVAMQQSAESIKEIHSGLLAVDNSLNQILKSHLKGWRGFTGRDQWFSSREAVDMGIATCIGNFSPPKGTRLENFF